MLLSGKGAKGAVSVHFRSENETQHVARLGIQLLSAHLARANQAKIRKGYMVVVVSIRLAPAQAIGPCAKFHVQSLENGFMRIVHATPIGDDHAIKTPFFPQDLIQQVVVVAADRKSVV